jgi:hypothetical protein
MLHTRKVLLKYTGEALLLHWCNTQDGGWNQTEVLIVGTTTYYEATIYHRHFVFATCGHINILSRRQIYLCWCDKMWVCFAFL